MFSVHVTQADKGCNLIFSKRCSVARQANPTSLYGVAMSQTYVLFENTRDRLSCTSMASISTQLYKRGLSFDQPVLLIFHFFAQL